jgi:heterodisulfide reductase subunit C
MFDADFKDAVLNNPLSENVVYCMQCGMCTGSCPVSEWMDFSPREIVEMIRLGLSEEVLNSNTLWICTSCYSCSVRCPRGIKPTELMNVLRELAITAGITNQRVKLDNIVMELIKHTGRSSEFPLVSKFSRHTGIRKSLKQLPFGIALMRHGKLSVKTQRMNNPRALESIFKKRDMEPDMTESRENDAEEEEK